MVIAINLCKFGKNLSGSRDIMQNSHIWLKFDLQRAMPTLKIMSSTPILDQLLNISNDICLQVWNKSICRFMKYLHPAVMTMAVKIWTLLEPCLDIIRREAK